MRRRTFLTTSLGAVAGTLLPYAPRGTAAARMHVHDHRVGGYRNVARLIPGFVGSAGFRRRLATEPPDAIVQGFYRDWLRTTPTVRHVDVMAAFAQRRGWRACARAFINDRRFRRLMPRHKRYDTSVSIEQGIRLYGQVERCIAGFTGRPAHPAELVHALPAVLTARPPTNATVWRPPSITRSRADADDNVIGFTFSDPVSGLSYSGFPLSQNQALTESVITSLIAAAVLADVAPLVTVTGINVVTEGLLTGGVIGFAAVTPVGVVVALTGVTMMAIGLALAVIAFNQMMTPIAAQLTYAPEEEFAAPIVYDTPVPEPEPLTIEQTQEDLDVSVLSVTPEVGLDADSADPGDAGDAGDGSGAGDGGSGDGGGGAGDGGE